MTRRQRVRTLRGTLFAAALGFGILATAAMVALVLLTNATARAMERDELDLIREDGIADRLINAAYAQRLAAVEYGHDPTPEAAITFELRGREAFALVRQYLFQPLPLAARLDVEAIKEAHERFEVAARRSLDAGRSRDSTAVRRLSEELAVRAAEFQRTVQAFVDRRELQHAQQRAAHDARLDRLQTAMLVAASFLIVVAIGLAQLLRRAVSQPLRDVEIAAHAVRAGDAGVRMPAQRFREFALVADSINTMAEHVHESRVLVEAKNRELRAALDDLRRTQQDMVQRETLSAIGEMLAGLSHELNNPLAAVHATAELMEAELAALPDSDARRLASEFIEPMLRESRRARDLVRNTLKFSRASVGDVVPVSLPQVVQVAVGLRGHAFAQGGKLVQVDLPGDLEVLADPQRLQLAVVNVLNNALDALMEPGATGRELRIHAGVDDRWLDLMFDDDGPGFANARQAFQPFYSTKPVGQGTGLGLALVHRFISECGGVASVANRADGGARVTLRLRRAPVPVTAMLSLSAPSVSALATPAQAAPAGQQATPAGQQPAMNARTRPLVLVVEDEESLRRIQQRFLDRMGVDVLLAENGEDARAMLATHRVDLVITDLRMPGSLDGPGLLRWLIANRPDLAATVIVVTGDSNAIDAEGLAVPPDRVLSKPFDRTDYERRVTHALEKVAITA